MANNFADHVAAICEEAGATPADVLIGTKVTIPDGPGPYVVIRETGGASPLRTHNSYPGRAYDRPSAQVRIHSKEYSTGYTLAQTLYTAIESVRNRTIGGIWYCEILMDQSQPYDMGLDDAKRSRVAFNAMGVKRPS